MKLEIIKTLERHVHVDDYFTTAATLLDLLQQELGRGRGRLQWTIEGSTRRSAFSATALPDRAASSESERRTQAPRPAAPRGPPNDKSAPKRRGSGAEDKGRVWVVDLPN
jgi:hypothetical protein